MALTILSKPDSPNVCNTNLIYSISSSNVPQYQFRYIADLYESGSSIRLARFKYPQNNSGTCNIDLSRPIADYMETDYNWAITGSVPGGAYTGYSIYSSSLTAKRFTIEFGEEYGTSYSSSVTTFTGSVNCQQSILNGNIQYPSPSNFDGNTGQITLATSSFQFNFLPYYWDNFPIYDLSPIVSYSDGTLSNNPNMLNAPATSKYYKEQNIFGGAYTLSTMRNVYDNTGSIGWYVAQPIGHTDLGTETYYSEFFPTGSFIFTRYVRVYNDDNNMIGGTSNTYVSSTTDLYSQSLLSIPVGMEQMGGMRAGTTPLSASISSSAQWSWYESSVRKQGTTYHGFVHYYYNEDKGPENMLAKVSRTPAIRPGLWQTGKFYPTYCNGEKTRFAFINSFGCWDYYNVYMPTRRVTNINRKTYEQPFARLNERVTQYNVSNRGTSQYYTEYTDEFEITTEMIDSQESQWLREMFESTEVFIQSGSNFIPVNILNSSETIINTTARNKNYRYTIRYQFSNLREPR